MGTIVNTPELDKLEDLPASGVPMWEQYWPSFATELCEKLARGHLEYGDVSFDRDARLLLKELQAEALDLAGWGFVLWVKIEKITTALDEGLKPGA